MTPQHVGEGAGEPETDDSAAGRAPAGAGEPRRAERPDDRVRPPWTVMAIAGVGGWVDAVGFLSLAGVFTSHMSGNTAALGAYGGAGKLAEAIDRLAPIPMFMLGIGVGAATNDLWKRKVGWTSYTPALIEEAALLLGLGVLGGSLYIPMGVDVIESAPFWWAVGASAAAMGIQTATLHRAAGSGVRTTFISGDLAGLMEAAVSYILIRVGLPPEGSDNPLVDFGKVRLFAGVYLGFVVGAVLGGAAEPILGLRADIPAGSAVLLIAAAEAMRGRA